MKKKAASSNSIPIANWLVVVALLSVQISFGGFHVFAKYIIQPDKLAPLALAGIRVLTATPLLLALAWLIEGKLPRLKDLPHLALLGMFGVFLNQILFILGLSFTTATNASIFMPSIPVFAAGAAALLRIEKISLSRLLGIALTVAGAMVMIDFSKVAFGQGPFFGNLLIMLNCCCFSLYLVLQRPILNRLPPLTVTAWAFLFGGIFMSPFCIGPIVNAEYSTLPNMVWIGIAFIILLPTAYCYVVNAWAVKGSSPSMVAAFTTMQPVITSILAVFFLGETFGSRQISGFVFIAAGLAVVTIGQVANRKPKVKVG